MNPIRRDLLKVLSACAASTPLARAVAAAPAPAVIEPRPLEFPADFGSHPDHRTEWWYLTGWLATAPSQPDNQPDAATFGFQVTFFRSRTGLAAGESRFAPDQLVFAHAALSDLRAGRQRHDQRIARSGFGVTASQADTDVRLRDWHLSRGGPVGQSVYRTRVRSDAQSFGFDFTLTAAQPVLLQGEAGFSRKGPDVAQASHYYSHPQLELLGKLTLDGQAIDVRGRGWMDHEWSDSVLSAGAVGWDWTGMNLDDGSALTAFQLRRQDGTPLYAGGSFRTRGGETRNFAAHEVRFSAIKTWKSAASGAVYPVQWRIETPVGRFTVAALLDPQELDSRGSTGAFYWEGLSELRSADDRRVGRGYLEMTGYAERLTL